MEYLIILAILSVVVLFVTAPLRRAPNPLATRSGDAGGAPVSRLEELVAAREAKYREIRDAELDHRTGKLSDQDYEAIDRSLRAEAIEILHAIDTIAEP